LARFGLKAYGRCVVAPQGFGHRPDGKPLRSAGRPLPYERGQTPSLRERRKDYAEVDCGRLLAVVATLLLVTPAFGGASPPAKTNACSDLDGSLAAESPGTQAFHSLARQALRHGCVAYVATDAPATLRLEFVRGPLTGTTITIGLTGVVLTDIALTSSGTLYGIDFGAFYTVDPDTGHATFVGSTGNTDTNGLVVGPTGTIYASTLGQQLLTINPTRGASTLAGNIGFTSSGDLAFAQDGTLYMTASVAASGDSLVRVDPTTGAGTLVGPIGATSVFGLVSSYGTLFGAKDAGQLLTIDPSTGAGTVIASGGPSVLGAASLPATT
jgi:hypothetical protein